MKKYGRLFVSIISSALALGFCASLNQTKEAVVETKATVDINDYSDCETAHKSTSPNKASELLTALRTITSPGSSGGYDQLWQTYKTAYLRDDGKIFDYYSNITNFRPGTDQAGNYSGEGDVYNREHSIPKSWWGGSTSNQGADPYIVVPTDGWVNSMRSNYAMGPVGSVSNHSANNFSKLGTCVSGWGNNGATVFEPDDSVKGDFARIIYYAIAKYSASYGWTSGDGSSVFSGSSSTNFGLTNYAIKYCSAWSALDPVSDWERSVNDKVAAIQGNRNPFIDHPEYANTLWGSNSNYTVYPDDSSKTLTSISLSNKTTSFEVGDSFVKPTVTAHFDDSSSSDVTNSATFTGYNMSSVGNYTVTVSYTKGDVTKTATYSISVVASTKTLSSIAVTNPKTSFVVGDTFSFGGTVTASYSNSTQADVTESATFTGYNLSQTGNQTITVSYTFQGTTKTATYTISVAEAPSEVTIAVSDIPTTYSGTSFTASGYSFGCSNIGSSYSSGNMQWRSSQGYLYNTTPISNISSITINNPTTGSFSGTIYVGSSSHPTSGTSYEITNGNTVNITGSPSYFTIQVGTVSGGGKSGSIVIGQTSSSTKTLSSISVATAPTKTTYTAGEYFDPTGLVITRTYSDSTSDTYAYAGHTSEFTFSPTASTALTTSNVSVTITYGGKSCSQAITVNAAKTLSSITVSTAPTKTTYTAGEYFDPTGLVIRRNYSDSTYDTYTYSGHTSEFTFSPSISTALTTSNVSVSITYGGKSCNQAITVNAAQQKTLSSIAVQTAPTKTTYVVDEYFDPTGLVITRNYSDSTSDTYTYANHTSEFTFNPSTSTALTTSNVSVTITYGGKSCNQAITVNTSGGGGSSSNGDAELYSGAITEGYYVIYYDGKAMKSTVSSERLGYTSVTASNDVISEPDASIVWHIEPSGNYWTLFNEDANAYAAGTGAKNKAQMLNDGTDDKSLWTIIGDSTYEFVNKANTSAGVNANLRENGTYGFACYSISTGGELSLYRINDSSSVEPITSISATVSKTFYVGESISKSDITVKDSNNSTISSSNFSFTNDGYQFTYSDAASGGASTSKTFTNAITYSTFTCSLIVNVQRKAYAAPSGTTSLEHTGAEFKTAGIVSGTSSAYAENQTATVDGITFNVGGYIYNNSYLSFSKSSTNAPGSVVNTTPYPSGITDVSVSGASPDIQLSVDGSENSWVDLSSATTSTTNYYYVKVYYSNPSSQSGYINISSISVTLKASETAENISNFIMYEDTNNQCVSKLPTALGYYKNLSDSGKTELQTSEDYVISTARTRLEAWALSQGKTIDYNTGNLINKSNVVTFGLADGDTSMTLIIIVSGMSILSLSVLLVIKKKRLHN